jgi:hypothetical protein
MFLNTLIVLVLTIEVPQASIDTFYEAGLAAAEKAKDNAKNEIKKEQEKITALGRVFADPSTEKIEYITDPKGKPAVKAPNRGIAEKEKTSIRKRIKELEAKIEAMPNWSSLVEKPIVDTQRGDLGYFHLRQGDVGSLGSNIPTGAVAGSRAAYQLMLDIERQNMRVAFRPVINDWVLHIDGNGQDMASDKLAIITGKAQGHINIRILPEEEAAKILKQCEEKAAKLNASKKQ